jgi:hypothetical protein
MKTTDLTKKGNGRILKTPVSSWDIGMAMRDLYDLFEKIMYKGVLLGDVAYQIKAQGKGALDVPVEVDHLEWGLPKKQLTPEVVSLFKTWGFTPTKDGYEYKVSNVPVKIKVYSRKYKFFERPDQVLYMIDEFNIPNPWSDYWKVRSLIK